MIKKTKLASYSVHKMNVMGRAKATLEGRGLSFDFNPQNLQIVIPTQQGKVVYYPLKGEYQHGMIRGYAENPESMISYIVKCGVIHPKPVVLAKANAQYISEGFDQVVLENPISVLNAIEFKINDEPMDIEYKLDLVKSYGNAIYRCNQILSELTKGSKEYVDVQYYVSRITGTLGRLKVQYPFLKKGGSDFSSCLLECLKDDVSEIVWKSYTERAHQKMLDKFFGAQQ